MISDEGMARAARLMQDAADRAERAANRMEESATTIRNLLEDGYGGNGVLLLEALQKAEVAA